MLILYESVPNMKYREIQIRENFFPRNEQNTIKIQSAKLNAVENSVPHGRNMMELTAVWDRENNFEVVGQLRSLSRYLSRI